MTLENKKQTSRYDGLWVLSDEVDVEEKEKMEDYVARFNPERKFSFTIDGATIDTSVFENYKPSVTFTSDNPYITNSFDTIEDTLMKRLQELESRMNRTVALVHNCQRCGASLEVDEHKSIFCCKYCGATYLLGSVQPNSVYN